MLAHSGTTCLFQVAALALSVDAFRSDTLQHDLSMNSACACLVAGTCSSCSMQSCPFAGDAPFSAKAIEGGGTASTNGVAAWRLKVEGGKTFVVKFGGPMEGPLRATRLAHALGVSAPRMILASRSTCPGLWEAPAPDGTDERFLKSLPSDDTQVFSVQEFADSWLTSPWSGLVRSPETPIPSTGLELSLWYQAGGVAALDWLTGKSDLFNDIPLEYADDVNALADAQPNYKNLIIDGGRCIAIDLDIGMPSTRWDLFTGLLEDLDRQDGQPVSIPWVQKVLIPVLSMVKRPSEQWPDVSRFGKLSKNDLGGYHPRLSPLLVQLGLSATLLRALELPPEVTEGMPGFDKVLVVKDTLGDIVTRHQEAVNTMWRDMLSKNKRCCEVQCTRKVTDWLFRWSSREACKEGRVENFTRRFVEVELVTGQKVFPEGTAFNKLYGDRNEQSCEQVVEKRTKSGRSLSFASRYCMEATQCGADAEEPALERLVRADGAQCE